jgi:hypothetical protein
MTEQYEAFCDASYYDMWCVRRIGERTFGQGFHVMDEKSALELKGELEALATENAHLTALVHQLGENAATAAREYAEGMEGLREALQYIADAEDLYEPCGWAVHSARKALAKENGHD